MTESNQPRTIFDPETCIRKGLCEVSKTRTPQAHNLYYELHGLDKNDASAAKIVFIMGLNNSCFGWHNQIGYFAKKPGYHCLVLDNRGVGLSDAPSGLYKTSEMAKDVMEVLDFVGWTSDRSLHVTGVSMGGMIAQELATLIPERIVSLVLTSTTAGNTRQVAPMSAIKMFTKLFFVKDAEAMVRIVIEGLYPAAYLDAPDDRGGEGSNRDRVMKEFLHRYEITRRQPMIGRVCQTAAALGHYASPERLMEISKLPKVAILTGDQDTIIDPQRSHDLEGFLPGSELIVFEGGGHAILSQFADRYNSTLERIFREGSEKARAFGTEAEGSGM